MKKNLILVLALLMAVCIGVGGTLAYLFVETPPVTNTFVYGDINITLKEDKLLADGTLDKNTPVDKNEYQYVPGDILNKRPYVTIRATSQKCYLFIQVEEANNTYSGLNGKIVDWAIDTAIWTEFEGASNVWYKEIDTVTSTDISYDILLNDQVSVNSGVTKTMINASDFKTPSLTFIAYAVQKDNVASASDAWRIANPTA